MPLASHITLGKFLLFLRLGLPTYESGVLKVPTLEGYCELSEVIYVGHSKERLAHRGFSIKHWLFLLFCYVKNSLSYCLNHFESEFSVILHRNSWQYYIA